MISGLTHRSEIKNPVCLARLILDHSTKMLSLRRVPPNLLVGQGATNFARDHGMENVPYDMLISPVARQRWRKWRSDMIKHERREQREEAEKFGTSFREMSQTLHDHDEDERRRKAHEDLMYAEAVAYGAQTASPPRSDILETNSLATPARSISSYSFNAPDDTGTTTPATPDRHPDEASDPDPLHRPKSMVNHPFANSTQKFSPPPSYTSLPQLARDATVDGEQHPEMADTNMDDYFDPHVLSSSPSKVSGPSTRYGSRRASMVDGHDGHSQPLPSGPSMHFNSSTGKYHAVPQTIIPTIASASSTADIPSMSTPFPAEDDIITDTVGAIAVDMLGNIACAASSGGIGMKHRGRVGPAALISIGASVIPMDDDDPEGKTVATVTSGTGEHMTTTMAAGLCSERIYQSQRKIRGQYRPCMEEEAIAGFIKTDFMDHPSVRQSQSTGAIGTLSVKKTKDGVHFLFGHNTDSFALASMHSDEERPVLTMSRSNGNGSVAQGGRYVRYRRGSGRK